MIRVLKKIIISLVLTGLIAGQTIAGKGTKTITSEDAKLWRSHSVTLSDNGIWYTVIYSLTEKPDPKKKKDLPGKKTKKEERRKKDIALYGEDAETDVLYIRHRDTKKEYCIIHGEKPLFSPASDWIAYYIKPKSGKKDKKKSEKGAKKKVKKTIVLHNLKTGESKLWKSDASFSFTEKGDHFISYNKKSMLLVDLRSLKEHYIGNISEFILPEKSDLIAYSIDSEDKMGNGIYIYHLKEQTTSALDTGGFNYSNLSWNKDESAIAAFKYKEDEKGKDTKDIRIIIFTGLNSGSPVIKETKAGKMKNMPSNRVLSVKKNGKKNRIIWSGDNDRLFLNLKKKKPAPIKKDKKIDKNDKEEPSIDVWHWKDKKLVSQQMIESKKEINKTFKAVFNRIDKKIFQLTCEKIQKIYFSPNTDQWAVGTDNRAYISDWDVKKNDLYRINLRTGEQKLIIKSHNDRINISPDGEKVLLWQNGHYWAYNFNNHRLRNITKDMKVSFLKTDHDYYGSSPAWGFAGWVKDKNSVIVNHKLDLWLLPLDASAGSANLTEGARGKEQIRFRLEKLNLKKKTKIEERYIDLSSVNLLNAFNIKTKYAGYYQLTGKQLKKLIFKPASYSFSRWRSGIIKAEKSEALVIRMGNYREYPESYLTDTGFSKIRKITRTNQQQLKYKWGSRILIDYTNDDGVPLQGVLSIPDGYKKGERLPMIVYSYEKLSNSMYRYPGPRISGIGMSELMYVSDGYLFLQPDIHFNVGTPHSDMHECIDAAINKVIELGYADEKAIGYVGFSFGGHSGMYISTQKNRFAAIAAGAGVSNLVQGFNLDIVRDGSNEQDYYMTQQGRLGASPVARPEMYIRESAVFNAGNMNTPLLLYHGTADSVVKWEHSFGLYSILRFLKKPVILLSYRGEGHGLRKKANRMDITSRLKEYFDHYLKGKKAPVWIIDGLPFRLKTGKDKKGDKEKKKRTVPVWK
ncbi:MAG: prolyl oligopeptidase family serine peptidase [Acidobacteriota bacterium]